jgi:hypothetical protein
VAPRAARPTSTKRVDVYKTVRGILSGLGKWTASLTLTSKSHYTVGCATALGDRRSLTSPLRGSPRLDLYESGRKDRFLNDVRNFRLLHEVRSGGC